MMFRRRSTWRAALLFGALAIGGTASWVGRAAQRAERQRVAGAADRLRADLDGALGAVLERLTDEARTAAGLAPLRAALAQPVDEAGLRQLLDRESWWAPFRTRLLVVVQPDGRMLASEPRALSITDPVLLEQVRAHPPAAGWAGAGGPFAAAAAPMPRMGPGAAPLVILGRPFDLPLAQALAARLTATILLTDGKRKLMFAGNQSRRAALESIVGKEGQHEASDRRAGWVAVAAVVTPSRWVWALREIGATAPAGVPAR
jgi:hypothetical protein